MGMRKQLIVGCITFLIISGIVNYSNMDFTLFDFSFTLAASILAGALGE